MEIAGRQDRISKLGDATLGCILSYLPAKEAARAAVLSSRWRHAFCGVHAISLEESEDPISLDYDEDTRSGSPCSHCDHEGTPRFASTITATLFARNRRPDAPPSPLRVLRVALYRYSREDASAVDHWVSYALSHAASPPAGLDLVLRLDGEPLCSRPYSLHVRRSKVAHHGRFDGPSPHMEYTQRSIIDIFRTTVEEVQPSRKRHRPLASSSSSDESDSEEDARPRRMPRQQTSSSESSSGSTASDSAAVPTASMSADRRRRMADSEESSDSSDDTSSEESDCHLKPQQVKSLADSHEHRSPSPPLGEDDDVVSDEPDPTPQRSPCEQSPQLGYTVPGMLFSCAALRSLSIGPCSLSPPAVISLPFLEELLLFRVSDAEGEVQRLIAACPRGLTLEACVTVTQLSLLGNRHLCRLALRCCHFLANVTVDDALHSLEYRGAVPETSLVTIQGGVSGLVSCKVDICGEEVSTADEFAKLRDLLQQLASTKHLHLQSPRLGAGVDHEALARFPAYPCLLHLELTGRLPHGDDGVAAVTAVSRILRHAPILKVITLVFHTTPGHDDESARGSGYPNPLCKKAELLDAHQLRYNEHEVLAAPAVTIPCLTNRVREINLVHYHGGRAQRTLAKFLLCNAPVLEKLYCGFARGPLWVQTKLKDEMQGWAMNKPEHNIFA